MIEQDRITLHHTDKQETGNYVVYWMQQAQRVSYNHALWYAIEQANRRELPLIVAFVLVDNYPSATLRHYLFMLEGIVEVEKALSERNIPFYLLKGNPPEEINLLSTEAALVVTDRGYLRWQREWRLSLANMLPCPLHEIETDVIIPVETVSNKEEYAARTIRGKIHLYWKQYIRPIDPLPSLICKDINGIVVKRQAALSFLQELKKQISGKQYYVGGYQTAKRLLLDFVTNKLSRYQEDRNDPALSGTSGMSPYLHFGQISPLEIALEAQNSLLEGADVFLEELVVRRELSMNYCWFNTQYDSYESLPTWAKSTLESHQSDKRPYLYSESELEQGLTHDPVWNAAQKEMVLTGKMHGYMRMYWGKKIIEWTETPQQAWEIALRLNNLYELDGRDPNGYTGVAWCFGKHDRPWVTREIFGSVRYMNDRGLARKFDVERYIQQVKLLEESL